MKDNIHAEIPSQRLCALFDEPFRAKIKEIGATAIEFGESFYRFKLNDQNCEITFKGEPDVSQ